MEYRVLGRTGVRVSAIALGTANFADPTPEDEAKLILERAIDAGINMIDTGDSYAEGEAERMIGAALRSLNIKSAGSCPAVGSLPAFERPKARTWTKWAMDFIGGGLLTCASHYPPASACSRSLQTTPWPVKPSSK